MQVNDRINGFLIKRRRETPALNGVLWECVHEKSGAELVWLDNKEENKLFSVAFKTLPWDDTGVFHIMEHSVLSGSRRFPVKEPFLDLLKSSLNTFLNAMTFSDKTVYPVSSRNTQDFLNLTRVYLDAVFCPAVYDNPNIFRQEGWHYELRAPEDTPVYKGVVFNEMKGAFANIDALSDYGLSRLIFPDSPYRFVSGGDPAKIPSLSYERFLDAHREFYHPANAKIYLDGDVPFEQVTRLMDEDYLSQVDAPPKTHGIPVQAAVPCREAEETYAVGKEETTENKTYFVVGKILCGWEDRLTQTAAHVLAQYLTGTNAAPLKRALLSAGLCQDLDLDICDGVFQPFFLLQIRNSEKRHKEEIRRVLRETVQTLTAEGIDPDTLKAELNQLEFSLRETEEPRGLGRNLNALTTWLYGGDPLDGILFDDLFASLRAKIGTGYYENLLADMLLDDEHLCTLTLTPSVTKAAQDAATEKAELEEAKKGFTNEQKAQIVRENAELDRWHNTPDAPEATATLPVLTLADVSEKPLWTQTEEKTVDGVRFLYHPVQTNGVVHGHALFEINDFSAEDLPAASFLTELFKKLPTERHDEALLQREIKTYIGALSFDILSTGSANDPARCRVMLTVAFSVLEQNLEAAQRLIAEILLETDFSDAGKIKEILYQTKDDVHHEILTRGHNFARYRAASAHAANGVASDQTDGFGYYGFLKAFCADFENRIPAFTAFAKETCRRAYTAARLTLSETATAFLPLSTFTKLLPRGGASGQAFSVVKPAGGTIKEAFAIPAGISYAVSVSNLRPFGAAFDGRLNVLSKILSYGYLWNEIRVKGGAYGCGCRVNYSNNVTYYSYRDPDPANSLSTFAAAADFIEAFVKSDETTDKYIIGAISDDEPLFSPAEKGDYADTLFLIGVDYADRLRLRKEMLALKKEDLLSLVPLFRQLANAAAVCVVGNEDALKKTELKQIKI